MTATAELGFVVIDLTMDGLVAFVHQSHGARTVNRCLLLLA
jgi:hypothetical protein